jgi:hypothetical protein
MISHYQPGFLKRIGCSDKMGTEKSPITTNRKLIYPVILQPGWQIFVHIDRNSEKNHWRSVRKEK